MNKKWKSNLCERTIDVRGDDTRSRLRLMSLEFIVMSINTNCSRTVDTTTDSRNKQS